MLLTVKIFVRLQQEKSGIAEKWKSEARRFAGLCKKNAESDLPDTGI